jgi:hypothetical protein
MKTWTAGYHVSSGFKVEFIEMGVPDSMIFDTEMEANDYFKDQRSDLEILKEKESLYRIQRLTKDLKELESNPMYLLQKIFFEDEKLTNENYKILKEYINLGIKCKSDHNKK